MILVFYRIVSQRLYNQIFNMRLDLLFEADGSTRRDFLKSAGALAASSALPVGLAPETVKAVKSFGGVLNCRASGFLTMMNDTRNDVHDNHHLFKLYDIMRHSSVSGMRYRDYAYQSVNTFSVHSKVDANKLINFISKEGYIIEDERDIIRNRINKLRSDIKYFESFNDSHEYIGVAKKLLGEYIDELNDESWVKLNIRAKNSDVDSNMMVITNIDDIKYTNKCITEYQTSDPAKTWWDKTGSKLDWSKTKANGDIKRRFNNEIKKSIELKKRNDYDNEDVSRWADDGGQNLRLGESFISKLNNILKC